MVPFILKLLYPGRERTFYYCEALIGPRHARLLSNRAMKSPMTPQGLSFSLRGRSVRINNLARFTSNLDLLISKQDELKPCYVEQEGCEERTVCDE
ncbi:hypothetical protein J6590_006012 [Homalodisca vitripennis]|nr:hypothetical protein J6590_006012 [Homalodisca vitripennis]